jgi:hypothetical protein
MRAFNRALVSGFNLAKTLATRRLIWAGLTRATRRLGVLTFLTDRLAARLATRRLGDLDILLEALRDLRTLTGILFYQEKKIKKSFYFFIHFRDPGGSKD